jgi:nucleoside-triphosphatase
MLDGDRGVLASVNSNSELRVGGLNEQGVPRYGVELGFLESVALPALVVAGRTGKVVVIDEIGPMQLYSDEFKNTVLDLAKADSVIFGTVVERSHPWTDSFKKRRDVETFVVTPQNRETLKDMFVLYMRALVDHARCSVR